MVHAGADDHHRAALGLLCGFGKAARDRDRLVGGDAGDRLLPGGGVRQIVAETLGASAAETPVETVIGAEKVKDGRHHDFAVGDRDLADGDVARQHIAALVVPREMLVRLAAEVRESDGRDVVAPIDQAQRQMHVRAGFAILGFEIPSPGRFAVLGPAVADGALRYDQCAAVFGDSDGLPCCAIRLRRVWQIALAEIAIRHPAVAVVAQPHQHRHVGIAAAIVLEVRDLPVEEELAQDHMAHGHGERRVGALLRVQPEIGEFGDFGIVGRDRHDLRAVVARLDEEMGVGRARLRHVGAPGDDVGSSCTSRPIPARQSARPRSAGSTAADRSTSHRTRAACRRSG